MDYKKLAQLLFPDIDKTPEDYEAVYPERKLAEGARVTRLAPSPTGYIHLGNLYGALADERLAHRSGGLCLLWIEDTDVKREVEGAIPVLLDTLSYFGEYEIVAVFRFNADSETFRYNECVNMDEEEFSEFMRKVRDRILYDTGVEARFGDRLLTLSTCEYTYRNGRLVVVARKVD